MPIDSPSTSASPLLPYSPSLLPECVSVVNSTLSTTISQKVDCSPTKSSMQTPSKCLNLSQIPPLSTLNILSASPRFCGVFDNFSKFPKTIKNQVISH